MAEIYKNAFAVYAELGPASEDEQAALKKMEYLTMFIVTEKHRIESEEGKTRATIEDIRLPPELVEPYDAQMWEGLGSFFRRSWWNRAWVIQEPTAISSKYTRWIKISRPSGPSLQQSQWDIYSYSARPKRLGVFI